jgi:hypothetical protein
MYDRAMTFRLPLLVVLAWCGCSSATTQPADMTVAGPADLSVACMLAATGDATAASGCTVSLCHPTSNDYESISAVGADAQSHVLFQVDGTFALRGYATADLRVFDVDLAANGKHYAANNMLAGSSLSATLTGLTAPSATPCDGIPHGTATAMAIEYDQSTGMATGSGRATVTVTF